LSTHVFTSKVCGHFVFFQKKGHPVMDFTHVLIRFNRQKGEGFHMVAFRR
jgi:hypothetical protein